MMMAPRKRIKAVPGVMISKHAWSEMSEMWSIFSDACASAYTTAWSCTRLAYTATRTIVTYLFRRATLILFPGGKCTSYVASWSGPPQPGLACTGQLRLCDTLLPNGAVISVLGRGASRPDTNRALRDMQIRQVNLLDAQLVLTSTRVGTRVRDVTRLLYTLPDLLTTTPFEVANLLFGNVIATQGCEAHLEVTTCENLEHPAVFGSTDIISGKRIFCGRAM